MTRNCDLAEIETTNTSSWIGREVQHDEAAVARALLRLVRAKRAGADIDTLQLAERLALPPAPMPAT
jgi:hypothetical protein